MKLTKDFKLSKESKRRLATMTDDKRSLWKKLHIEAELAEKMAKFAKIRERSNTKPGEKE
jgi:hypothetical protein